MIARCIDPKPENDNYARLAKYIADAPHKGEKCLLIWTAGCAADQDYDLAISEVVATQGMKKRTQDTLTYHLMVSFRPGDVEKLTPEDYKDIETHFARALGFEEHQRHCAVHINTENLHIHMAYNKIHPQTKNINTPVKDFYKLSQACWEMEQKYGLYVDKGIEPGKKAKRRNSKAKDMEAHSGLQSFDSYVKERKEQLQELLANASTWQELHQGLAKHGLAVRLRGAGCVIVAIGSQAKDNHSIKAGEAGRGFTKGNLEKKFGPYERSAGKYPIVERYTLAPAKPLRTAKEREMWRVFLRERKQAREANYRVKKSWQEFKYQFGKFFEEDRGMER